MKPLLILVGIYPAWLAMMAVHEMGHVFHALISGGKVRRVSIPLWGFSFTELETNLHPRFVAWGGVIWGCLLPLVLLAALHVSHIKGAVNRYVAFFVGFCFIANGAYLFSAIVDPVGDAADLVRDGVSQYLLCFIGFLGLCCGLFIWNRLTRTIPPVRRLPSN